MLALLLAENPEVKQTSVVEIKLDKVEDYPMETVYGPPSEPIENIEVVDIEGPDYFDDDDDVLDDDNSDDVASILNDDDDKA